MTGEITLRSCTWTDWPAFVATMFTAFGNEMSDAGRAAWEKVVDPELLLAAIEREETRETIVGTAGWIPFDMTVPGGEVSVAAVTMVTVRPTHRRRGILRSLMTRQLADVYAAGIPVAALWASESAIYQRFGYGQAYTKGRIEIDPRRTEFLGQPDPVGRTRILDEAEAQEILPPVYEQFRRATPASFRRSPLWWEARRLAGPPPGPGGGGPMQYAALEIDGQIQGYAIYRVFPGYGPDSLPTHALEVVEAIGTSPVATREIWRYLFGVDLIATVRTSRINAEHPLSLLLTDPRRLRMSVADGTWVRIVDVKKALESRTSYGEDSLTFELADAVCPWNAGVWTIDTGPNGASVTPATTAAPDLRLTAGELAAMYLGTVPCTRLMQAGRVEEKTPGAASRADVLFRSDVAPWCLDDF